jgi:hypothetical protein
MNRAQNLFMDRLSIFGGTFISDMLLGRAGLILPEYTTRTLITAGGVFVGMECLS